jgi:DNA-binding response OmpR family regulator
MDVLLIEPDRQLAATYTAALQSAGHAVRHATTAQDGIFLADERTPELIILELQLVSHGGIEFLYELRSYPEWQAIPVIANTHVPPAEFMDSWDLLERGLGVAKYVYKPRTTLVKFLRTVAEFAPQTATA